MIQDTLPPVYQSSPFVIIDGHRYEACKVCGRVEQKLSNGLILITHDEYLHFGIVPKPKATPTLEEP